MDRKRLDYLDMAKGIGMVLVLVGHLQGEQIFSLSPYIHPLCVFIFSFHMPLFFIISGILMAIKMDENKPFSEIAVKRFKGIMVPYYCFSFCYMMVVVNALIKGTVLWNTFFVNLWYVLSGYGMNVLWFLPALYLGELLFIWLRKKTRNDKQFIITVVILCIITFVLSYLLTLPDYDNELKKRLREFATVLLRPFLVAGFISIGYYLRKFAVKDNFLGRFLLQNEKYTEGKASEEKIIDSRDLERKSLNIKSTDGDSSASKSLEKIAASEENSNLAVANYKGNSNSSLNKKESAGAKISKGRRAAYIGIGLILLGVCAVFSTVNNGIDVRTMVLRNIFFFLLCALSGSFGLILFCKGLPRIGILCYWGTGSLIFMATHNSETVLYYAMKLAMYVNQYLTRARGYICYAIIILVILIYTTIMIFIIKNYLPFMIGKPYKKKQKEC